MRPRSALRRRQDVDERHHRQDTRPAFVPSTVWGTASRRNRQVELGAVLALNSGRLSGRRPPRSGDRLRPHQPPGHPRPSPVTPSRPLRSPTQEGVREGLSAIFARVHVASDNRTVSRLLLSARVGRSVCNWPRSVDSGRKIPYNAPFRESKLCPCEAFPGLRPRGGERAKHRFRESWCNEPSSQGSQRRSAKPGTPDAGGN